ncbi:MAG TPA: beta-galactosidase [Kofleriaceae bacterium]|nr:beta-galactosidase [Kofleriaceae bacterium]
METRRRTWFDDRGLVVAPAAEGTGGADGDGSRPLSFYAGAMHYWRVDPSRWARCLAQIHDLGLTLVETYVPWRVHEPAAGRHAWDGPRDLARFVDAARAAGLAVVLRPGPHINAELTGFGMPDHVLAEPACQARTASGSPVWLPSPPRAWPVPSYASRAFLDRVHAWYAELARVIGSRLAPGGPVVAIGVDNEAQMFFRLGAFDHDYHPDAIAAWREASGLDGEPPRAWDPADAARCISWLRFKDQYVAHALGAFARSLDEVGLGGVARFHNLPPGHHGLYDQRGIQRAIAGPVGIDAYTPRAELRALRQRAIAAVGNAAPVPIAFEVGVGFAPWLPPLDAGDDPTRERDQLLSLLAAGMRGFNLFMAVERDRFYGAAIDRSGKLEPHAAWIRTLISALVELSWPTLRRAAPIAVVDTRADARFGQASCVLDPMTPVVGELLGLGPAGAAELGGDPAAILARRWQAAITRALDLARVPYTIVDESASEAELAERRAVIVPTFDRIDRGLAHTLRALAEHPAAGNGARERPARRRAVVVIGPGTPTHDELGQPLLPDALPRRVGRLKAGSLEDLPGLAADLAAIAGDPSDAWQIERPDDVHAYVHADPAGEVRVVFVASDVPRPVSAVLLVGDGARGLRDPFGHERVVVAGGRATIALGPRGVRMLIVERA